MKTSPVFFCFLLPLKRGTQSEEKWAGEEEEKFWGKKKKKRCLVEMDASELLFQAVVQTVDALSFTQSHVIDEDFRAHSKATINSVRSLQREQRSRVEQTYGARAASAETLAAQLTAVYRGETASLELAKEANGQVAAAVVALNMTQRKCHAFKKEMKQRIHEWERAFREEHGVAVTAHDKAALRQIYELYKAAKNRLKETEMSPGNTTSAPRNGDSVEPQSAEKQRREHRGSSQLLHESNARNGEVVGDRNIVSGGLRPSYAVNGQAASASSSALLVSAPIASSDNTMRMPSASMHSINDESVGEMSQDDLVMEKRYLKRILHHFEGEFERRHGRPPTKSDRRVIAREYTRYGELKNEILRRSGRGSRGGAVSTENDFAAAPSASAAFAEDV